MAYWESLTNWSLAVNLDDPVASVPFPASQVETVKVENFPEQSRFPNSQHGKGYPSCIRSWSVLLTFQFLKVKQGSTPRIDRSNVLRSLVLLSQV
jgi:hypothetical protein